MRKMQNSLQFKPGNTVKRQDVPAEFTWHIKDIYPDEAAWQKAIEDAKTVISTVADFKGSLTDKNNIALCLHLRDTLSLSLEKIYVYASLQKDTDASNSHLQEMTGTAQVLLSQAANAMAFIEPELLALPKAQLEKLVHDPDFKDYDHYFANLLRSADHVLSASEEALLAKSTLATSGAEDIFRNLTSADLTFPVAQDEKGQPHPVSEGSYLLSMTSKDRTLRQNTFNNLMSTYHHYRNTLAATLNNSARAAHFYATARKYADTREALLANDNIPCSLYDNFIDAVHANLPALHAYMALKKQVLGVEELHPYDIYVPISKQGGDTFHFTFEEAKTAVKEALAPLGADYQRVLEHGMKDGWVDIYENQGKRSGAYSCGVFGIHPYVLLNYQPRYNGVTTLAHEMGHAMHSFISSGNQPLAKAEYTIFCAEVASTTNEILLLEYMLTKADKEQKIYLLHQYLEAVRATVYRQTQFAEFEKILHGEITAGRSLTADFLEKTWHGLNVKYYGNAFTVDALLDSEWSRIPHFYTPFYVYQYATGYSAATAFAQSILGKEPQAVEKYFSFLRAGGSDYSLNILKNAGVDLTTPVPVDVTLGKFKEKLQELKELLK